MNDAIPRMRMFAGPNGSGKSTIKGVIEPELLGVYINPDEIEKEIALFSFLDMSSYGVKTTADEVLPFSSSDITALWNCLLTPSNTQTERTFLTTPFMKKSG